MKTKLNNIRYLHDYAIQGLLIKRKHAPIDKLKIRPRLILYIAQETRLCVCAFTLDTRPLSVGRMNLHPNLGSIPFDMSSTGGD